MDVVYYGRFDMHDPVSMFFLLTLLRASTYDHPKILALIHMCMYNNIQPQCESYTKPQQKLLPKDNGIGIDIGVECQGRGLGGGGRCLL